MKLQRYRTYTLWDEEGNPLDERPRSVFRVFDVLEWRDSIRAAVEAEREAAAADARGFRSGTGGSLAAVYKARAALDALLADGGE